MDLKSLILISVDDHIVEPPDMFDKHLPAKWRDVAPRVVRSDEGSDDWVFAGNRMPSPVLGATAGRDPKEWGLDPTSYDEVRLGCYDVKARIDDMNVGGVLASMCFPQFPGFGGRAFSTSDVEPEVAVAVINAYNDWHIDDWCASAPGRFIPMAIVPLWDASLAAKEVRRVAAKGCHSITIPTEPGLLGFPSLYDQSWDPLWRACAELGTVVNMHVGSAGTTWGSLLAADAPIDAFAGLNTTTSMATLTTLVWSKLLVRFPELRTVISEGGLSWFPHMLDRIDDVYNKHTLVWTGTEFGERSPVQVARDQVYLSFVTDALGLRLRDDIGLEHICWEQDYPHSDSTWPNGPEAFLQDAAAAGLTDHEANRISHENAMELYQFDPFTSIDRDAANVAALRALATHVDTTPKSFGSRSASAEGHVGAMQSLTTLASGGSAG